MTSRRWSGLPAHRPTGPAELAAAVRPAAAVVALAAFLVATLLVGRAGAAHSPAAPSSTVSAAVASPATLSVTTPALGEVIRTLAAIDPADAGRARQAAGRSYARAPLHRWVRPYGGVFSSPFGYRWGHLHAGVDLAGPWGTPFVAATDGCIEYAGPQEGYGEVMRIRDWDGTETVYGHMSSFIRTSGCVRAGEPIARIGESGDATGPHLHFEIHVGGMPVDPVPFLAKRGVFL